VPRVARTALPLLTLNSVTMLGAELYGRSYGGGVLKMEPREAAVLPVPGFDALAEAWGELRDDRAHLANQLRDGIWTGVVKRVDDVLLRGVLGLTSSDVAQLHSATRDLRARRLGRREGVAVGG
jgi:adenine-specific DNA-methyltransferase